MYGKVFACKLDHVLIDEVIKMIEENSADFPPMPKPAKPPVERFPLLKAN
jgi:hypothetical protein